MLPLAGELSDLPFFAESASPATRHWRLDLPYRLSQAGKAQRLPVWLGVQVRLSELAGPVRESGSRTPSSGRRLKLAVRFENRIDLTGVVRGSLEVGFRGTLCGLKGVTVCHPLGQARTDVRRQQAHTIVSADFSLSLAGLRYQDSRVVPDGNRQEDRGKVATESFPGVVPDHETVIELMNAMSDDGLYVKRLVENPPRSGGRANVANRYWDIAGRRYDGVYPVDFHLVLTGEEVHSGDVRAAAGNTKVRMTVQGAYASEQMMERILDEWERLHRLLCDTLRNRPRRPPAEPAAPESNPEEGPLLEPDSARGRRSVLLKRREDATSALLEGRISETTYREIVERTTRELDEFDES